MIDTEKILAGIIKLGKENKIRISPRQYGFALATKCNLKCIMCPGHGAKENEDFSLKDFQKAFGYEMSLNTSLSPHDVLNIQMTSSETLTNKDAGAIYEYLKTRYGKNVYAGLISNGVMPFNDNFKKVITYADGISISIDGATKETYESIRAGASFDRLIENLTHITKIKRINCFMFVAMNKNIRELPGMIMLAKNFKVPSVFVQKCEFRATTPFNKNNEDLSFDSTDKKNIMAIEKAKLLAQKFGIYLNFTNSIENNNANEVINNKDDNPDIISEKFTNKVKMCSELWKVAPTIRKNSDGLYVGYVCCHMPHANEINLLAKAAKPSNMSIIDFFNSQFYWDLREDILNGKLASTACKDCQYIDRTQWKEHELSIFKEVVKI